MMATDERRFVPIVELSRDSNGEMTYSFLKRDLRRVLRHVKTIPVRAISISGPYRTGKSYLLNLLDTYLTHIQNNGTYEGWENSDTVVSGIKWAKSKTGVTNGIHILGEPYIFTLPTGRKFAVVLIDCQGTGDTQQSNADVDNALSHISMQMSTDHIVNVQNRLSSDNIVSTKTCLVFGDSKHTAFNRLIYLVRDWDDDENLGKKSDEELALLAETGSEEVKCAVSCVRRAFKKIDLYSLTSPGKKIKRGSESDNLCVKDGKEKFLTDVQALFYDILYGHTRLEDLSTGNQLIEKFKRLEGHLSSTDRLRVLSGADSFIEQQAKTAYTAALRSLNRDVEALKRKVANDELSDEEQMAMTLEGHLTECLSLYQAEYSRGSFFDVSSEAYTSYKKELRDQGRRSKENLVEALKNRADYQRMRNIAIAAGAIVAVVGAGLYASGYLPSAAVCDGGALKAGADTMSKVATMSNVATTAMNIAMATGTEDTAEHRQRARHRGRDRATGTEGTASGATAAGTASGATAAGTASGATATGTVSGATAAGTASGATAAGTASGATATGTASGATTAGIASEQDKSKGLSLLDKTYAEIGNGSVWRSDMFPSSASSDIDEQQE